MGKLIHEALSEHILGAAMAVLNELKLAIRATCPPTPARPPAMLRAVKGQSSITFILSHPLFRII